MTYDVFGGTLNPTLCCELHYYYWLDIVRDDQTMNSLVFLG